MDGMVALRASKAVAHLDSLVAQLGTAVFSAIPRGDPVDMGSDTATHAPAHAAGASKEVSVHEVNTHPTQGLGFEAPGGGLGGKRDGEQIPVADWTPEMQHEIKLATRKLKAGDFGDPSLFHAAGRADFNMIMVAKDKFKYIYPSRYLIALGINRYDSFHAKGLEVALAAGGDRTSYQAGPLKTFLRVASKCVPGGDYYSRNPADLPNCKRVMDILRGSVMCSTSDDTSMTHQ